MRLLLISAEFPPFGGGAGSYACNLVTGVAAAGYDITCVTLSRPNLRAREEKIDAELARAGATIRRLPLGVTSYLAMLARGARAVLAETRFDHVVLGDRGAHKAALFLGAAPMAMSWPIFHGSELINQFESPKGVFLLPGVGRFARERYGRVRGIVCVSEEMARRVGACLPALSDKIYVVPHGIDTGCFYPLADEARAEVRRALDVSAGTKLVLCASRLVDGKGHDLLLRSWSEIRRRRPDAKLVFAGDGPLRADLEASASALGLHESVLFLGRLDRAALAHWYQAADLFVLLSESESFGLVFVEAGSCGVPVVAGAIAGVDEAVRHGETGLLVAADPGAVADACVRLLDDPALSRSFGQRARARIEREFSLSAMAQATCRVLAGVPA